MTLKVGIIGCGGIANGKHMPSLLKAEKAEMVAFCDNVLEKAEASSEKEFGGENASVYTNYVELLQDKSIDVIHVCTPNISHAEISIAKNGSRKTRYV